MLNICVLMGRFTHSLELKTLENNVKVVKFSLAVARSRATPNDERKTDFIDCTAWNKTAEFICNHFKKGEPIIIEGRLETRQYQDKQGNNKKTFEVLVKEINFCAFKKDEGQDTENLIEDLTDDVALPF